MAIVVIYKKSIRHGYARAQRDGRIVMTVPYRLRDDKKFCVDLYAKAEKLEQKLKKKKSWQPISDSQVMIFGDWFDRTDLPSDIDAYLTKLLGDYIQPLCDLYAAVIGKQYVSITIKKLRSKRGSCSSDQKLVFNRALVHLPLVVVRYVVVHEVAHLVHKHHQKSFWSLVTILMPDFTKQRKFLRDIRMGSVDYY